MQLSDSLARFLRTFFKFTDQFETFLICCRLFFAYESVGRGFESLPAYQITAQNCAILGGFALFLELLMGLFSVPLDRVTHLLPTAK